MTLLLYQNYYQVTTMPQEVIYTNYQTIAFTVTYENFTSLHVLFKIGNSLPDYVVAVDCVNTFKTRLDKYWKDRDVMYDWSSEITGTGDRSEYILESI